MLAPPCDKHRWWRQERYCPFCINDELEAQVAALTEATKEAYFDGWSDGRNTTSVTGDPTDDWNDSYTRQQTDTGE